MKGRIQEQAQSRRF